MDRHLLRYEVMTTAEWLYSQTVLTDMALDMVQTPEDREFVRLRLEELRGRVAFEQRSMAKQVNDTQELGEGPWDAKFC
jgi:hypothetical protein